jgi:hypothetical protein
MTSNCVVSAKSELLKEFPDYYTRLEKMETEAEKYWHNKN